MVLLPPHERGEFHAPSSFKLSDDLIGEYKEAGLLPDGAVDLICLTDRDESDQEFISLNFSPPAENNIGLSVQRIDIIPRGFGQLSEEEIRNSGNDEGLEKFVVGERKRRFAFIGTKDESTEIIEVPDTNNFYLIVDAYNRSTQEEFEPKLPPPEEELDFESLIMTSVENDTSLRTIFEKLPERAKEFIRRVGEIQKTVNKEQNQRKTLPQGVEISIMCVLIFSEVIRLNAELGIGKTKEELIELTQ